jgi:hypothetical protein
MAAQLDAAQTVSGSRDPTRRGRLPRMQTESCLMPARFIGY